MRYETPASAKEAAGLLKKEKGAAFLLAGGTDLLVKLKMGIVEPDLVVDIKRIPKISEIQSSTKGFTIGAAVSGAELGEHAGLKKAWPGVVEAANLIGSDQIQGRATLPGNLCNASPAADSVPALIAAGAKAVVVGPLKKRTVAVEKIVIGPGKTSLAKGELIEAITLPKAEPRSGDAYLRFTPRTEMDIAVVGIAISLKLERGVIKKARVVLGAVAPTAIVVAAAAKAIVGSKLDDKTLDKLAAACSAACNPIDDKRGTIEYRVRVAGVLAKRAAKIAFQRAGGSL
ncbi:MAG: carbon-monoxide dehydrogenase medium subunit [Candidatus Azotimanducaceae bacterium]|jgi:carbon-monoxide dehydrogenase medium subunit|tara:strand:+ start:1509 stop:2369 length:861 start_codon:yes stop_codon:yes gene_type:complete